MDPDTDLEQYGFTPGTTPRNIRALAHMVQKMKKLVTANILSDATFSGLLSAKYLSLNDINTYQNLKFGVILEAEQSNIISASTGNQNSGREKNFNNLVKILKDNSDRNRVPDAIKQNLNLTDSEYAQLYRQVANFKYDSQFKEDMTFTVGEKTFTGTQVRDAIIKGADATLSGYQNEWTVYTPKINAFLALVKSFEHIPQQYLDFIWNNNNLPIIIM